MYKKFFLLLFLLIGIRVLPQGGKLIAQNNPGPSAQSFIPSDFAEKPLPLLTLLAGDPRLHAPDHYLSIAEGLNAKPDKSPADSSDLLRALLMAGKKDEAKALASVSSNDRSAEAFRKLVLAYLLFTENKFQEAAEAVKPEVRGGKADAVNIRHWTLYYTCLYLGKWAPQGAGNKPVFPRFNGAFYYSLRDSIRWDAENPGLLLNGSIRTLADLIQVSGDSQPVLYELLGDLLYAHPIRFCARWYSCFAYYHASEIVPEAEGGNWKLKAIYSLESNRRDPRHYDDERFSYMEAGVKEERARGRKLFELRAEAEKRGGAIPDSLLGKVQPGDSLKNTFFAFLPQDTSGALVRLMRSDNEVMKERAESYNPNTDLENKSLTKKVKSNVFFNFYAVGLILLLIVAAVFIIRYVRRIDREYHNTPHD